MSRDAQHSDHVQYACALTMMLVAVAVILSTCAVEPAAAARTPPLTVLLEADSLAKEPGGPIVPHPPMTTVEACRSNAVTAIGTPMVAEYDPTTRVLHVIAPCESLFGDGFD